MAKNVNARAYPIGTVRINLPDYNVHDTVSASSDIGYVNVVRERIEQPVKHTRLHHTDLGRVYSEDIAEYIRSEIFTFNEN